ncbi:MAG: hypothetical protein AMXMBFR61_14630 [Fimbriimonadales bacterium]
MTCLSLLLVWLTITTGIQDGDAVLLRSKYAAGEKRAYTMTAKTSGEVKAAGYVMGMPFKATETTKYTLTVLGEAPEDTADVRLADESSVTRYAEMFEQEPWEEKGELSWAVITLSPTNEILKIWDQSKPKKKDSKEEEGNENEQQVDSKGLAKTLAARLAGQMRFHGLVELGPKLPWYPVKVGDTWQDTLTVLRGEDVTRDPSRRASRTSRMDITYRYDGLQERDGKKVHFISATYSADLDLKSEVNRSIPRPILNQNPIRSATLKVSGKIEYQLDPSNGKMLRADWLAESEVELVASPGFEMLEYSLKGKLVASVEPTK